MAVSTKTYRIATIPGDGIGIEVTHAAIQALQTAADRVGSFKIEFQEFPWGTSFYKQTGSYLPDKFVTILKDFDAILFGAVGAAGDFHSPQGRSQDVYSQLCRCSRPRFTLGNAASLAYVFATICERPTCSLPHNAQN